MAAKGKTTKKTVSEEVKTKMKSKTYSSPRLFRSSRDKVVAGVCGGLADYFNIESTLVRLIFILITVFGGSGILLYIVLWLVIPKDTKGGIMNQDTVRENAAELKVEAQKMAEEVGRFGRTENSKYLFGLILIVLGAMFLLGNFGVFRYFHPERLWPLILIVIGFAVLSRNARK